MRRRSVRGKAGLRGRLRLPLHHLQEDLGRDGDSERAVPSKAIAILEGEALLRSFQPPEGTAKTFCSVCGSNLFGFGWPASPHASVRLSALESPFARKPEAHIFVRSVTAWETLPDDGAPRYETLPE